MAALLTAPDRTAGTRRRRLPGGARRLALTAHLTTSVGWLGIVVAMLIVGVVAATTISVYKPLGRTRRSPSAGAGP